MRFYGIQGPAIEHDSFTFQYRCMGTLTSSCAARNTRQRNAHVLETFRQHTNIYIHKSNTYIKKKTKGCIPQLTHPLYLQLSLSYSHW
jgi:hypothetical protein